MTLSTTIKAIDQDRHQDWHQDWRHEQSQASPETAERANDHAASTQSQDCGLGIKGWMEARRNSLRRGVASVSSTAAVESSLLPMMLLATFCLTSIFALSMMLSVGADYALAQDGSQIQGAITSVRNWLAGLIVALGGVALLVAIIIFLFSGSESRRRAESARYIGAICVAIAAGLMVPAIIGLIQGFAGGGGG